MKSIFAILFLFFLVNTSSATTSLFKDVTKTTNSISRPSSKIIASRTFNFQNRIKSEMCSEEIKKIQNSTNQKPLSQNIASIKKPSNASISSTLLNYLLFGSILLSSLLLCGIFNIAFTDVTDSLTKV